MFLIQLNFNYKEYFTVYEFVFFRTENWEPCKTYLEPRWDIMNYHQCRRCILAFRIFLVHLLWKYWDRHHPYSVYPLCLPLPGIKDGLHWSLEDHQYLALHNHYSLYPIYVSVSFNSVIEGALEEFYLLISTVAGRSFMFASSLFFLYIVCQFH